MGRRKGPARVHIYFNFKKKLWSVMHRGIVIAHVRDIMAWDVQFIIRPAGQRRARREGRKNVHAFAIMPEGNWTASKMLNIEQMEEYRPIHYHPFTTNYFLSDGKAVDSARMCCFMSNGDVYGRGIQNKDWEPDFHKRYRRPNENAIEQG
jgi:hypothetical protein